MVKINREDMLELTRRMTLKRNCFGRIAGTYMDDEGFADGTFNKHLLRFLFRDKRTATGICLWGIRRKAEKHLAAFDDTEGMRAEK